MKKLFSLLLIGVIILSFASCKVNSKKIGTDEAETTTAATSGKAQQSGNGSSSEKTTKNYSGVLNELNNKESKFVDTLGVTEKGKKIVAFFGDDFETQFIVAEFKDGKVSSVKNYRFFKEDSKYEAYKILAKKNETGFVDHEESKCIEQNETKKYRGKTYEEMQKILAAYYNFK